MNRIANTKELQTELRRILALAEQPNPSREAIASELNGLRERVASGGFGIHKPAEADEALAKAYNTLHSFKADMDRMEEIPKSMLYVYNLVGKSTEAIVEARKHTYQLRETVRRGRY